MNSSPVIGVILAGGLSTRMGGGYKTLRIVAGRTILDRVINRIGPQCSGLVLNANGAPSPWTPYGLPVIPDGIDGYAGPLAGILAGLDWVAANRPEISEILSVPADCPFLPADLVSKLQEVRDLKNTRLAAAASGGWTHPVVGLWPVAVRERLRGALLAGERKIDRFTAGIGIAHAEWSTEPFDPFFNVNTPDEHEMADALALMHPNA